VEIKDGEVSTLAISEGGADWDWPEELSEEDRLSVARARKLERFLSQPFFVGEPFTGMKGQYVSREETVRGFKEIVEGKHDDKPEQAFYMKGGIDDVK